MKRWIEPLKATGRTIRRELTVYQLALQDPRTPRAARWILGLAVGYALSPIDLIPDFIPVLGYLDDAILVPLLIGTAARMIPDDVMADCRRRAQTPPA